MGNRSLHQQKLRVRPWEGWGMDELMFRQARTLHPCLLEMACNSNSQKSKRLNIDTSFGKDNINKNRM